MKRIKSQKRIDTLATQDRRQSGRWTRAIYLGLLAIIALVVLNYTLGDAVVLRADGMVVRDRYAVAATFPAKVAAVYVQKGDYVEKDHVLAKLESAEILKDIAQLSVQYADISTRDAQLKIRSETTKELLPLAEKHAEQTASAVRQHAKMADLIPTGRKDEALGSEYTTAARLAELKSESKVIRGQLPLMQAAQDRAAKALTQLEAFYDQGNIRAPLSGIVGSTIPIPGQVAKFGDVLFDIYGTRSEVLAYLPEMYLFPLEVGQTVEISGGRSSEIGTVDAILPVTDALPPEFQNTFRPRDRGRLVRIKLPEDNGFAISQKIEVSGCALGWCWPSSTGDTRSLVSRVWSSLKSWELFS
jgi:multidrug resistance efflux pump